MAGVTLGFLKYVLGLDTISFRKGMTDAERDLVKLQKSLEKKGQQLTSLGKGLTAAITLPIAGIAAAGIKEAQETQQAMAQVEAALTSMGPVAGKTADQLKRAADALELKSTFEADEILRKVTANLLTFGKVGPAVFDRAQQSVVDLATRMGTDLQSATILVGKALNDPVKGLNALNKAGIQFTADQKKTIKAMVETGNVAGAQAIILGELERQYKGSAAAAANTDPLNQANKAWKQMTETIGTALLPILPRIAEAITAVSRAFTSLSPETQKWILIAGGAAAALGPLLIGFGAITTAIAGSAPAVAALASAFGLLAPAATAAGGATAAVGAAALPLAPILAGVAAGALAVYAAYQNWDKIKPWIDGVVERTNSGATDINAKLKSITDGANALDQRLGIPSQQEFLNSIVSEVSAAVEKVNGWLAAIQNAAKAFDQAVVAAFRNIGPAVQQMVAQVTTWLNKLAAPFNWVIDKTKAVAGAFYDMANKVVFNSYVPDMVDGIQAEMARLDAVMVKPAAAAASKTATAFRELQQQFSNLLSQLFPEQAKQIQFDKDMEILRKGAESAKWSVDQLSEAIKRLRSQTFNLQDTPLGVTETDTSTPERMEIDWEKVGNLGGGMPQIIDQTQQWKDMLSDIGGALFQRIGDSLSRIVDGSMKLKDLWKDLLAFGLQVLTSPNGPLGNIFGGARASGGPVMGKKAYLVGERGPELFMPGGTGRIVSHENSRRMMGSGGAVQNFYFPNSDADSFRRSETQVARASRRRLGVA